MNLFTKINSHDVKKLMYIFLGNIQFCCNDSRFYDEILLHSGYDAEFEKLIKFESLKICMGNTFATVSWFDDSKRSLLKSLL